MANTGAPANPWLKALEDYDSAKTRKGANMNGCAQKIIADVQQLLGMDAQHFTFATKGVILPGYFRRAKSWDLLIKKDTKLVAAIELKSIASSVGNNFNNRCEEALGSALDLNTAFKKGLFPDNAGREPFVGYFMYYADELKLVEESPAQKARLVAVGQVSQDFASCKNYLDQFRVFCQHLVDGNVYTSCCLLFKNEADIQEIVPYDAFIKTLVAKMRPFI